MKKEIIEKKLRKIIKKNAKTRVPIKKVLLDDDLTKLGVDSIQFVKLIIILEKEFKIAFEITELSMENLFNLNNIINIIQKKQKEQDTV